MVSRIRVSLVRQVQIAFGLFAIVVAIATVFGWRMHVQVELYTATVQRLNDVMAAVNENRWLVDRETDADLRSLQVALPTLIELDRAVVLYRNAIFIGSFFVVVVLSVMLFTVRRTLMRPVRDLELLSRGALNDDSEIRAAAGLLGHEINNLLSVILARAELLEVTAQGGDLDPKKVAETASKIRVAGDRIAGISKRLRDYAKGSGSLANISKKAA